MLLSAVSVLVVAESSSEIPEGLMNNPVFYASKSVVTFPNTEIPPISNNRPDGAQDTCVIQAEASECRYSGCLQAVFLAAVFLTGR